MRQIDIEKRIVISVDCVSALARSRRMPEVGPVGLVYSRPWTEDVEVSESFEGKIEHFGKVGPRGHVCADVCSPTPVFTLMFRNNILCLWPQLQIGEDDVAIAGEKKLRKGEIDAWTRSYVS
jgi:hypothetical protein